MDLLRCLHCGERFTRDGAGEAADLRCLGCQAVIPIRDGVARFVRDEDFQNGDVESRTRASFGYEWTYFRDWQPSGTTNFNDYFSDMDPAWLSGRSVLDAGCGIGRHARFVGALANTVLAIDFSSAIDQAARNVVDRPNVFCIQADLMRPPVADSAFDLVYSLGVLHHLEDAEGALRSLVRALKPGGRLRVYLYWKRGGVPGAILFVVSLLRRITTRLPFGWLRGLCWVLSIALYVGVIVPYRILKWAGWPVTDKWPLAAYMKYRFRILYNDQFDRFSAPLEKRYSEGEVRTLLERAGLVMVQVLPRFGWLAEGIKPESQEIAIQRGNVPLEAVESKS